jgi:hypothetical protein
MDGKLGAQPAKAVLVQVLLVLLPVLLVITVIMMVSAVVEYCFCWLMLPVVLAPVFVELVLIVLYLY